MKKFLLLLLLILVSCSSSETDSGAYTKSISVENRLSKKIPAPWVEVKNEGSDLALNNKSTKSFFIFNSACRKFDPSNLPTLTNSLLAGINNLEVIEKSTITHQEREALLVIAKGSIDGVDRYFRLLTTQKNNCIYDFALIATTKKNLEKDTNSFNNFIQLLILN